MIIFPSSKVALNFYFYLWVMLIIDRGMNFSSKILTSSIRTLTIPYFLQLSFFSDFGEIFIWNTWETFARGISCYAFSIMQKAKVRSPEDGWRQYRQHWQPRQQRWDWQPTKEEFRGGKIHSFEVFRFIRKIFFSRLVKRTSLAWTSDRSPKMQSPFMSKLTARWFYLL